MSNSARFFLFAFALLVGACERSDSNRQSTEDPKILEARKLLAEAGYPEGRGFPVLEILYNDADWHRKIAASIQEMWRKNLGVHVRLRAEEWRVFLGSRAQGNYEIARGGFLGEYRDPHAFLSLFMRESGFNSTGWVSEDYERILREADEQTDTAIRYAHLARAERLLLDSAPLFPVFHYVSHNWMKPFIRGVWPNFRDMHPMQHVFVEGEALPQDGVPIMWAGEEASSLDPALSHDIRGLKCAMNLFEGLVNYDPKDASPVPGVAERWEISEQGRRYTFFLRATSWSNGDPVTAHDFVYAWRRAIDPVTASQYKDRMYFVKHGRAIANNERPSSDLGVRALDDRTLIVDLEHPAPYFPSVLCLNLFFPVHRASVEKHGKDWIQPQHMVNNGPYRLAEWKVGDRQVFVKNPRYRAADEVKLNKFIWITGSNPTTAWNLYLTGACHWTFQAPTERMPELVKRSDHVGGPYNCSYFYVFNVRKKPLDDARVRRALSLVIDKKAIVEKILQGGETVADRLTPMLYPGYEVK